MRSISPESSCPLHDVYGVYSESGRALNGGERMTRVLNMDASRVTFLIRLLNSDAAACSSILIPTPPPHPVSEKYSDRLVILTFGNG